jgi:hypothetical protein
MQMEELRMAAEEASREIPRARGREEGVEAQYAPGGLLHVKS